MSQGRSDNTLDELLSTSEAMQNSAQNGEWEAVAELDVTRRLLLNALLKAPTPEATHLSEKIDKIFSINKEVISLASEARTQAAEQQRTLTDRRHVAQTYDATQRGSGEEVQKT